MKTCSVWLLLLFLLCDLTVKAQNSIELDSHNGECIQITDLKDRLNHAIGTRVTIHTYCGTT